MIASIVSPGHRSQPPANRPASKTQDIFMTIVDVPIGEPLTPQMVKLKRGPQTKS
jgi:hypothetical protein